ncbi:MAG: EAL domain-containing protein [Clostridia bacterium]|nr:EAL domain-containing protein [Clostridia bacterium]
MADTVVQIPKKRGRPRKNKRETLRPIEFLYRQIYDTSENVVLGYEASLQINDPKLGTLPYNRISKVVSKSELAVKLGKWQILEACEMINRKKLQGKTVNRIFVTLSPKFLGKSKFFEEFSKIVEKNGISPNVFCIQISEAELQAANAGVKENLRLLRENGVKIAVINFGAESSSLLSLSVIDVDYLKLDASFAEGISHDSKIVGITESIIELCDKLDILIIADGIDTKEQLEIMKRMRCFLIEGEYFSKNEREDIAI